MYAPLVVIACDCPAPRRNPENSQAVRCPDNRKAHTDGRGPATALHVKSRGHSRPTAGNTRARPSSHNIVEQGAVRTAIRQAPNRCYRVRSGSHRLSLTPAAVPRLVIQLRIQRLVARWLPVSEGIAQQAAKFIAGHFVTAAKRDAIIAEDRSSSLQVLYEDGMLTGRLLGRMDYTAHC